MGKTYSAVEVDRVRVRLATTLRSVLYEIDKLVLDESASESDIAASSAVDAAAEMLETQSEG